MDLLPAGPATGHQSSEICLENIFFYEKFINQSCSQRSNKEILKYKELNFDILQ